MYWLLNKNGVLFTTFALYIFLLPVLSVSHPSYLEEQDPDSFGILFYARSGVLLIWQRPVALAPLNDRYIFKPSFNLLLSIFIGLVI
jgi:hypothetical protein